MIGPLVLTLALIAAAPAGAQHYQAKPAARPAEARIIARDTLWNCGDSGCVAPKNHSRAAIVCALLAKEVGALDSFSVAGKPIPATDLEKCNARARQ